MLSRLLCGLALVTLALTMPLDSSQFFASSVATQGKSYTTPKEAVKRTAIFQENIRRIATHDHRWTYAGDFTTEEHTGDSTTAEFAAACSADGGTGTCIDTNTQTCSSGLIEPNHCPGAKNIACCVTDWGSCTADGKIGKCEVTSACSGTTHSGLCPGPNGVECCTSTGPSPPSPKPTGNRTGVYNAAMALYTQRAHEVYTEGSKRWSGINEKVYPPEAPAYSDCSAAATWCYWTVFGSGPDFINGEQWQAGYTGTMVTRGREVVRGRDSYAAAKIADLVFYGDPVSHVAIYVGNGKVVSHGSDPVHLESIDYRDDRAQIRSYLD